MLYTKNYLLFIWHSNVTRRPITLYIYICTRMPPANSTDDNGTGQGVKQWGLCLSKCSLVWCCGKLAGTVCKVLIYSPPLTQQLHTWVCTWQKCAHMSPKDRSKNVHSNISHDGCKTDTTQMLIRSRHVELHAATVNT